MSRLFDALQRSEAERSGVDLSALETATEVLERAEGLPPSKREIAVQVQRPSESGKVEHGARLPIQARTAAAVTVEVPAEPSTDDKPLDPFSQFQSLKVSVSSQGRLVCLTERDSLAAEKFGFLGVRLQHLRRDRQLQKVLITSTIPQEGKSVVSANLACALAQRTQQRTLLVEGDVRRPSLLQMFGLERTPGICEWLQGESNLTASVYYLEGPGLWFLPAGSAPKNPLEILQSGRLPAMMDQLAARFDWIVVDSPPVLPLADTSVWMRLADGILLVARQGVTEKRQLERGLEAIEPKKMIGALLNGSKRPAHSDYYYAKAPP